jgi:hypothetical protein
MKKFNNTLEGTDCGDAGLPAPSRDIAKPKTVLRVVPKTPNTGATVIRFPMRGGTSTHKQRAGPTGCWKGELG